MKYQALILVVLLIVHGGVSTTKIQKHSEIFKRLPRDVHKCTQLVVQTEDKCLEKAAKKWGVTLKELDNAEVGTRLYCCSLWDIYDCMLAEGTVNHLI